MKRIISLILAIGMIMGVIPIGEIVAWADERESEVKTIEIIRNFHSEDGKFDEIKSIVINSTGTNSSNAVISIENVDGGFKELPPGNIITYQQIEEMGGLGSRIKVKDKRGEFYYNIDRGLPRVSSITPVKQNVKSGDTVVIKGSTSFEEFSKINLTEVLLKNKGTPVKVNYSDAGDIKYEVVENTNTGPYSLNSKITSYENSTIITRENRYSNIFSVYGELKIDGDISMSPNRGPVGTIVTIEANGIPDDVSVFLKKNINDLYDMDYMGEKIDTPNSGDGKDRYRFKVPNITNGTYEVVLTNRVRKGQDPNQVVTQYKAFEDNTFIVISDGNRPKIESIDPKSGPTSGIEAIIKGKHLGSISDSIFRKNDNYKKGPEINIEKDNLEVIYKGENNEVIGTYTEIEKNGKPVDVISIKRQITGIIGNEIQFKEKIGEDDSKKTVINPNDSDYIAIDIPKFDPENDEDLIQDITLDIETEVRYQYKAGDEIVTGTATIKENVVKKGSVEEGFIFQRLTYKPEITNITPNKIPIDEDNKTYVKNMKIAIYGENFFLHRYIDKNGDIKKKYPIIEFQDIMNLDPNKREDIKMQIFDKNGNELEGAEDGASGVKILLTMPLGFPNGGIKEGDVNANIPTRIINPNKNDIEGSRGDTSNYFDIKFVKPEGEKTIPEITSVTPNVIRIGKNNEVEKKTVIISGNNFDRGVEVYIEGEKIESTRNNDGEIEFVSPEKLKGMYQILVQNSEGGVATFDEFIYTQTLTDIRITDFAPKRGTKDLVVTMTGEEFKKPNPSIQDISGLGIYDLIGTRILLGDKDINEYNRDNNNQIKLIEYTSADDDKILKYDEDEKELKLSDYYHSVIMEHEDENKVITRYTLNYNLDTRGIELLSGNGDKYIISQKGDKIIAEKGGIENTLKIEKNHIELDGNKLMFHTPYKVVGNKIVGNRVKVTNEINRGELTFIVPNLRDRGYYDVVAINPDMNEDSRIGEKGFYYNPHPGTKPKINRVEPNEGPMEGGNYVTIKGNGFFDQGIDNKTSVFFGNQKVDPKDVKISSDWKSIEVKVPAYNGEIKLGKHHVVVSVLNPDEGSFSYEDGFNYIKATSKPIITGMAPKEGSASGENLVTIMGRGFLFFEPYEGETTNYKDLNKNDTWDDLRDPDVAESLESEDGGWEKRILPILPKVYFGSKQAKIVEYDTDGILTVVVPKGEVGDIEVYLMNNDMGKSDTEIYKYKGLYPKIESYNPKFGSIKGKNSMTIFGEGFDTKDLQVQFGNRNDIRISNYGIGRTKDNYGEIRGKATKVDVGDLTVEYNAKGNTTKLIISAEQIDRGERTTYGPVEINYNDKEIFFDVNRLKNDKGESYPGYEKVRIDKKEIPGDELFSRIIVDRGFSPEVLPVTDTQVSLKTPSHYDVGKVNLTLINPDGTFYLVTDGFEYRVPDSDLVLENILKRLSEENKEEGYLVEEGTSDERKIIELPYSGGIDLSILGEDFRKTVEVTLTPKRNDPSIPSNLIPIKLENLELKPKDSLSATEIIAKMKALPEDVIGHEWVVNVDNKDGSSGNSADLEIPIYIKFTRPSSTDLKITSVTPNFGPTAGGTTVTIKGEGFKETLEGRDGNLRVYFIKEVDGIPREVQVPQSDIISVDSENIVLKTPPFTAGKADIKVVNPDDGNVTLKDGFNYVSSPRIISVVDPENDKFIIETLSVEGGQKIKILGSDFMEGARVVFNPVLELVENESQATGDIITIDDKKYILKSGILGTEVERIDGQTITVTTPAGKLGDKGVIVINPDQGATNIYNIVYGIPEIASPFDVKAEIVFDQFIRVNWTGPKEAVEYEIYMSEQGGKFEFIGTTELTSYAVQKLKPNTKYQFLLKAMGKYGTSKPIDEAKSNIVTTGKEIGPIDESGKTGEKTQITINGTNADIILGSKDFTSKGMIFDLTRGDLGGVKDITIRMPANVIASSLGKIQVIGKDYKIDFAPNIFKTSAIEDNKTKSNAGVVFKIASHNDNMDIKPGTTVAGGKYKLEAVTYVDKGLSKMDHLNGKLNFTLNQNALIIKNRKLKTVKTVRYDDNSKTWVDGNIANRLGLYTVMGSRR